MAIRAPDGANKGVIVVASRNMKQEIIGPSNVDFVISFLS